MWNRINVTGWRSKDQNELDSDHVSDGVGKTPVLDAPFTLFSVQVALCKFLRRKISTSSAIKREGFPKDG